MGLDPPGGGGPGLPGATNTLKRLLATLALQASVAVLMPCRADVTGSATGVAGSATAIMRSAT
jgi:hypothetical protein